MQGCQLFPPSALAAEQRPDLVEVPVCQAYLDLADCPVSGLAQVLASMRLKFSPSRKAARQAQGPRSSAHDRRRYRVLSWGACQEAAFSPERSAATAERGNGVQSSAACSGWMEPLMFSIWSLRFPWLSPKQPLQWVINSIFKSSTSDFARSTMRRTPS